MNRFDTMSKEAMNRVEELVNSSRLNELLHKREEDEKKKNCILSAFLFSICLELMQLVTERGFCQIDDVWTNTLGAWIGWMISRAIKGSEKGRNLQP